MNWVRYDATTGEIIGTGWAAEEFVLQAIGDGDPLVLITEPVDYKTNRVNLTTKQVELIPPEELPPPPPPPPSPPITISDRQFFQQAAIDGYITQADALAAVQTGFIPLPLQAIIDQIVDPNEQFAAEMLLSGATAFVQDHPLVAQIGAAFNLTPEQIDTFFRNAMAL